MKLITLYSSRTGNTKQVAEAIASVLPEGTPCLSVKEAPTDLSGYDGVFVGCWVDRGTADEAAQAVLKQAEDASVALFATLGADPDSEHGKKSLDNAAALLPKSAEVLGKFICQGKVDPNLIAMMNKKFPKDSVHGPSPKRDAMLAEAAKHPDEKDLEAARNFAKKMMEQIRERADAK